MFSIQWCIAHLILQASMQTCYIVASHHFRIEYTFADKVFTIGKSDLWAT